MRDEATAYGRAGWSALAIALTLGSLAVADGPAPSPLDKLKTRDGQAAWQELSRQNPRVPTPVSNKPRLEEDEEAAPASRPGAFRTREVSARNLPARPTAAQSDKPAYVTAQLHPVPAVSDPARTPKELKKLTDIRPYTDYEPDVTLADQCQNLCPRPPNCPPCQQKRSEELGPNEVGCAECPEEVVLSHDVYLERNFAPIGYAWEASNVYYNPLYTEDFPLERYGHTRGPVLQPAVSVVKFATQTAFLPYQMTLNPPWKCEYPLGYYRPGDCVPYKYYQPPLSAKAALVQATTVVGAYYLIAP